MNEQILSKSINAVSPTVYETALKKDFQTSNLW